MATQTRTYAPKEHLLSFAGITLTAFGNDSFIKVAYNEEGWALTVGAGGAATRSRNENESGRVTITLQASSPENDLLMAVAILDKKTAEGAGVLFMKDNFGTSVVEAGSAWIVKIPDMERAKVSGEVEWVIETGSLGVFIGGNVAA